jgi:hypothetical protein
MSVSLRIALIIVAIILIFLVISLLKKNKIPVKYSLVWILSSFIILILGIFPGFFAFFSNLLGFKTISNMVIGILIVILLMITIVLTVIVSEQTKKINLLIQELSMLKGNKNDK